MTEEEGQFQFWLMDMSEAIEQFLQQILRQGAADTENGEVLRRVTNRSEF